MLGEVAFGNFYLAAPANCPAATDGIDIDTQAARGIQHRRAARESPALARRHEDNNWILVASHGVCVGYHVGRAAAPRQLQARGSEQSSSSTPDRYP